MLPPLKASASPTDAQGMGTSAADLPWDEGPGLAEAARRYWWLLLASALVLGSAGYGLSLLRPVTYEATARLLLSDPSQQSLFDTENDGDAVRYLLNQVTRIKSRSVAERASELLDDEVSADTVRRSIEVASEAENDLVTVTASAATAELAAGIANAVGNAYQDEVRDQVQDTADRALNRLEASASALRERLERLDERIEQDPDDAVLLAQRDAVLTQLGVLTSRQDQIAVEASLYGSGVELFEQASVPSEPADQGAGRMGALGAVVGLTLGMGAAWLLLARRESVDHSQDPAVVLGSPLLGAVPDFDAIGVTAPLPTLTDPRSPAAEAYQFVVASLASQMRATGGNTILLTSPQPGDGKSVTALNLAIAASRDGRDVLVVDADARVGGLSRLSKTDGGPGLHEVQADPDNLLWSASRREMPDAPGVEVVPRGSEIADPAGFFRTRGFAGAMQRFRDYADLVIVDSPPLLAVSDTSAIAAHVDGVILVVAQGTPLAVLHDASERLKLLDVPLLGYIFNRADERSSPYAYRYDYGASAAPPRDPSSNGHKTLAHATRPWSGSIPATSRSRGVRLGRIS